jgi:hypothetical protein
LDVGFKSKNVLNDISKAQTRKDTICVRRKHGHSGIYIVRIQNNAGIVWSLDARLDVTPEADDGGWINFSNQFFGVNRADAPVFDIDGVIPLNGSGFLAQLYGGPSIESLRPVGEPSTFQTGFQAGIFNSKIVVSPTTPPGSDIVIQVRAWDATKGSSYEESRALGGKFGKSDLMTIRVGGGALPTPQLLSLQSFNLQAGRPQFTTGQIEFVERLPDRKTLVFSHMGEPGFRYVIEKSVQSFEWHPYLVITNEVNTITFTDSTDGGSEAAFYRSRILD